MHHFPTQVRAQVLAYVGAPDGRPPGHPTCQWPEEKLMKEVNAALEDSQQAVVFGIRSRPCGLHISLGGCPILPYNSGSAR